MKKNINIILVVIISLFVMVTNVSAKSYELEDINMSIDLDEWWFTFTRYNLENNDELDALNITKDYMEEYFENNDAFLDAIYYTSDNEYIELTIHKYEMKDNDEFEKFKKIENLKNAKESDIGWLGIMLSEEPTIRDTIIYETENCLYLKNYYSLEENYQLSYITIANNQYFIINFTSNTNFDDSAEMITDDVVDNIFIENNNNQNLLYILFIVGAVLIIVIFAIYNFNKKRNKKRNK